MSGEDESNDRKQIWLIRPNCLVRKDAVASGMTRNSRPYICSKSCIPMFDTAAILEESVMAACVLFLPPVFDDSDMTLKSSEGCTIHNERTPVPWPTIITFFV